MLAFTLTRHPSLFSCRLMRWPWHTPLALAERVTLNVRMRCLRTPTRWIRVRRLDAIRRSIAEVVALQHNRKRTEVEIVEYDLVGGDR